MMKPLVLDAETTTFQKGNPYAQRNKLCAVGGYDGINSNYVTVDIGGIPYGKSIQSLNSLVDSADLLIYFNAKFDIAWLRRYGINLGGKNIWDLQYAHFCITGQEKRMPSLNEVLEYYGLPLKKDIVKEEYWENKCTCHVSPAEHLLSIMQKVFVENVTIKTMKFSIEKGGMNRNGFGEKQILNAIEILLDDDLKNYELILKQRLGQNEPKLKLRMESPTWTTIGSWLKLAVQYAEKLKTYALTTTIIPEKLGIDCAELVMPLWDTLRNETGWRKHLNTCYPTKIDTPDIPYDILEEYTIHDCVSEYKVFLKQTEYLKDKPQLKRLIWTGCKDILVTQEMEWNGLKFDVNQSLTLGDEYLEQIKELDKQLYGLGDWPYINWNSGDHLSCVLYGGPIAEEVRQTYPRTLKSGAVVERSHWVKVVHQLPRLVKPDDKTKLKKEGFWSTDEKTLKSLQATGIAKEIIRLSLERSKIEKKIGTYLHGFPKLYKEMDWEDEILHGQLNHCVAKTGRLSSSRPNQQNLDEEIRKCIVTRFSKN